MLKKLFHPLTLFVLSATFLVFVIGYTTATFSWFPTSWLRPPLLEIHSRFLADPPAPHHLQPKRHEFSGVIEHAPARADIPEDDVDLTFIASFWQRDGDALPGFRAITRDGKVVHEWPIDILTLWPESPHEDSAAGTFVIPHNYLHGSHLFDNGDILFSVEFLGLMRMAPNGDVVWRLDRRTHHSVTRNERGNFWVSETKWVDDVESAVRRFFGLIPPIAEDRVIEVTPDGEIVQEISVLEVLFASDLKADLWKRGTAGRSGDVLHLNDVEELGTELAGQYPQFDAGDLVVSLRHPNLVFVFDPETQAIKWSADGPHLGQHDPDFLGDGWISIFDNRADGSPAGSFLGGSRLVAIRPHTGETKTLYPRPDVPQQRMFHTEVGGKAQRLADGNWLLTETTGGRVLEVDAAGKAVWEWCAEPVDDAGKIIPEVYEGSRYTFSREAVLRWGKL